MWTWFSNEMRGRIPIWKSYQIFHLRVVLIFTFFVSLWECSLKKFAVRYLRMKRAKEVSFITWLLQQILFVFCGTGDPDGENTKHLQEMRTFVEEFYCNFKTNYAQMAKRHRSQLKRLKTCPPDINERSSKASRPWSKIIIPGFFASNYDGETKSAAENFYEDPDALLY